MPASGRFIRRRAVLVLLGVAVVLAAVLVSGAAAGSSSNGPPQIRVQQQSSREGRIVFIFGESSVPHPSQLGVRDADGRNARPLKPYSVSGVSWAPDGRSIAFGVIGGGISTMNIDGRPTRQRRVIRNGGDPDWSPNGRAIAFDRFQQRDVWVF